MKKRWPIKIKCWLCYIISKLNILNDLIDKSGIYEKLVYHWENFISIYNLEEPLKDFYSFYSLKLKKVKISFYYFFSFKLFKPIKGGTYRNGKITISNCFEDSQLFLAIILHELAYFNDLFSLKMNYDESDQEINFRILMRSIILESKDGSTDEQEIIKIKEFLQKYSMTRGLFIELYADSALMFFFKNNQKYTSNYIDYLESILKLSLAGRLASARIVLFAWKEYFDLIVFPLIL